MKTYLVAGLVALAGITQALAQGAPPHVVKYQANIQTVKYVFASVPPVARLKPPRNWRPPWAPKSLASALWWSLIFSKAARGSNRTTCSPYCTTTSRHPRFSLAEASQHLAEEPHQCNQDRPSACAHHNHRRQTQNPIPDAWRESRWFLLLASACAFQVLVVASLLPHSITFRQLPICTHTRWMRRDRRGYA